MSTPEERARARDAAADAVATPWEVKVGNSWAFSKPRPIPEHGTDARYKHKTQPCHCELCLAGHREAQRRWSQAARDRKKAAAAC